VEVRLRRYMKSDLPSLVEMLNKTYKDYEDFYYAYEFIPFTEDYFQEKAVGQCPTVLVAEDQEVSGFATSYLAHWGDGIDILCVKRGPKRTDIENLLISRIEREAESDRVVVTLTSGSQRIGAFQEKGYKIYGGLYHMSARLKGPYHVPRLQGQVTLRRLAAGEEEVLTRVFHPLTGGRRFQHGFLESWREEDPFFTRDWVHVAEIDGEIASVACTRRDHDYNRYFNESRAIIGPLVTAPEYRQRGLAKALVCRALNFFITQGIQMATLRVVEDNLPALRLYRSLGFEVIHLWKFLRKYLPSGEEEKA